MAGPSVEAVEAACMDGHAWSCEAAALAYDHSVGVRKDVKRALGLYQAACGGGDPVACITLGDRYQTGFSIRRDLPKSAELFRKACESDERLCPWWGDALILGRGVGRDAAKGKELVTMTCTKHQVFIGCKRACKAGDKASCQLATKLANDDQALARLYFGAKAGSGSRARGRERQSDGGSSGVDDACLESCLDRCTSDNDCCDRCGLPAGPGCMRYASDQEQANCVPHCLMTLTQRCERSCMDQCR